MKKDKFITDFNDIPTPRQKMSHLSLEERKLNFKEVDLGFTEEIALKETSRCLSCRRCIGCGLCLAECDQQAIVYDQKEAYTTIQVDSIVVATGTESFDARRKPELGYTYYSNVITSIEMERILSANGPFGGILMRPSDGEIPQRIGFIQCVGSRDEDLGLNYCSNICCTTALKQSIIAKELIEGLEVTIFCTDFRPFSANSENYYLKAKDEYGIKFVQAKVSQVLENSENNNLTIKYSKNGSEELADFDLIVLSTGITAAAGVKRLSRQFGARLNKYGFFPGSDQMPVPTSGDEVWFAGSMTHPTDLSMSLAQASAVAAKVLQSFLKKNLPLNSNSGPLIKVKERTGGNRIGVFFCRYGLSSQATIDNDDVIKFIENSNENFYVSDLEYGCNTTAMRVITDAIEQENLGQVIIAPCYADGRHLKMFQQVIQSAGLPDDRLSILTIKYENGGLNTEDVKQQLQKLIESEQRAASVIELPIKMITETAVIGNSITALQSALDIAQQGYKVHLLLPDSEMIPIERQIFWHSENIDKIIQNLKEQVTSNSNITIYKESRILKLDGASGNYNLTFRDRDEEKSAQIGAIVIASGAAPYTPVEFGYHENQKVITQRELKELLSSGNLPYQKIVMIQCVGSRQPDRPYCSQICCEQAIKNALKIKEIKPETEIYVLHRDIRVYDFEEDNYTEALEKGVKFIRMDTTPIIKPLDDKFHLHFIARASNQPDQLEADLIVLSTGILPHSENPEIAKALKVPLTNDGFFHENDELTTPLHLNRAGVFVAGLAGAPQRLENALMQASAVAGRIGVFFRSGKLF